MALSTMYPAMPGSPKTALAADITAAATSMTVADASALPAAPNVAVLGSDEGAEVVVYTTKSGTTISGLIRGQGGTTASTWPAGTEVARNITSLDHALFMNNITALNTDKQAKLTFDVTPTENSTNPVTSGGIYDALDTKQDSLTFDDDPTDGSNNPVKSNGIYDALALKAPLASPSLTGSPTAPTQTDGDSTTNIATTAFVTKAISNRMDKLYVNLETAYSTMANLCGYLSSLSTGDACIIRIGAGDISASFYDNSISYASFLFVYKGSSSNAYFFAFSRDVASIGNISIANNNVSVKHMLL